MQAFEPASERELCEALMEAASVGEPVGLGGAFSKDRMNPAPLQPRIRISTRRMNRILRYDPADLTISVQAGLPWADLTRALNERRQMVPLDPPYFETATVGGVVAANTSGPRRRLYGSVRDCVIGMSFATLEGRLINTGGMVVKNVAGLDMAKLMIGSFGTLAGIAVVNFKVSPLPAGTRTFAFQFTEVRDAMAARDRALRGPLQPAAIDLLNPAASRMAGLEGYALLIQASGSDAVLARYQRELQGAAIFERDAALWARIREFTPEFVAAHGDARVARISCTLSEVGALAAETAAPVIARAGSGVCYAHFSDGEAARTWRELADRRGWKYVFEYGEPACNNVFGADFEIMKRVKDLFDPRHLLNPGRLYGRI
jgi:glycolate oxidase FAD binding subunit